MTDSVMTIFVSFFPGVRPGFFARAFGVIFLIGLKIGYDKVVGGEPTVRG